MSKKLTQKEKDIAMAKRVEEAKTKIIADREAMKKGAVKITAKLLKGVSYTEQFPVRLVNGTVGLITIRPLAEEEMITVFDQLGVERMQNMGGSDGLSLDDYEFFWTIVSIASKLDKKLIKQTFAMGESAAAGQRILEISGMIDSAGTDVERFP
jgi:hypothetical protein